MFIPVTTHFQNKLSAQIRAIYETKGVTDYLKTHSVKLARIRSLLFEQVGTKTFN
jgi:hypothetical protein